MLQTSLQLGPGIVNESPVLCLLKKLKVYLQREGLFMPEKTFQHHRWFYFILGFFTISVFSVFSEDLPSVRLQDRLHQNHLRVCVCVRARARTRACLCVSVRAYVLEKEMLKHADSQAWLQSHRIGQNVLGWVSGICVNELTDVWNPLFYLLFFF